MEKISSEQQFNEIISKDQLVMIVFKADWCKDCHFIDPFMPEIIAHYQSNVAFYEVDRDELPELCSELNILGIPSFVAFKQGRELVRFVSKLRKTRQEIEQFIDRAIEVSAALIE